MPNLVENIQKSLWLFPALALNTVIVGKICQEACVFLHGDILGLDLELLGIAFYFCLFIALIFHKKFYPRDWLMKAIAAAVALGVGAEYIFIKFQVQHNIYCPRCIISGVFFLIMFFLLIPQMKKWVVVLLIVSGAVFTSLTFNGSVIPSYAEETQVPSFGNEKSQTEVIVYSDYFCPACSKTDEQINEVLRKIQDKVKIHFVDVPMHAGSLEYAEVFLYVWMQNKNSLEVATQVREMLFSAAKRRIKQREVLDILKTQGIAFHVDKGQAGEIFRRLYNPLMKKDAINGTPSIVIVKDNHRKKYQGTIEIVKALEEIFL
jgi:uncharacterized membrane protein